jgi:hypothetical protein
MDIFGYEIDIYLVIAVTAGIFVFGIIYLMSAGTKKKKPAAAKKKQKVRKTVAREKQEVTPSAEFEQEPQPQLAQRPQFASLMKSSEAQVAVAEEKPEEPSSPLPITAREAVQQKQFGEVSEVKTNPAVSPILNAITADSVPAEMKGAYQEQEAPAVTQVQASEIAQASESKQGEDEDKESDPLDDIFSTDEEEDSEVASFAAALEDIDMGSIKKLSEELSGILGRSTEIPRR